MQPHLADIAEKIMRRECVLFLGAAIHAAPPKERDDEWPLEQRPPMGSELSLRLAAASGLVARSPGEDPRNLARVSLDYEIEKQRAGLVDFIRKEVQTGKRGSPLLQQLAQLDFPVVVTTNFDTHFEDALAAERRRPFVSAYRNNLEATERTDDYPSLFPTPAEPFVVKIHGDIVRTPRSLVVTEEDYIQFVLRMSDKSPYHPVPEVAKAYLAKCSTLFLGYSLRDYNLRLLFKTLRWRMEAIPQTYSVDFRPDPLVQAILERRDGQISYIVDDVWKFVPELVEVLASMKAAA
jgi:hypothetical protein